MVFEMDLGVGGLAVFARGCGVKGLDVEVHLGEGDGGVALRAFFYVFQAVDCVGGHVGLGDLFAAVVAGEYCGRV